MSKNPKPKPVIAEKAKANILSTQKNESASAYQKSDKQINTNKELAKVIAVTHELFLDKYTKF